MPDAISREPRTQTAVRECRSRSPRREPMETLTSEGNPAMGDAEFCKRCGVYEEYMGDDVFMCTRCFGRSPPKAAPRPRRRVTSEGNPPLGDAEFCERCGVFEEYMSDGVFLCTSCFGRSPEPSQDSQEDDGQEDDQDDPEEDDLASDHESDLDRVPPISTDSAGYCSRCRKWHDWSLDEFMNCQPPAHVVQFGHYRMDRTYRAELDRRFGHIFTTEEIVGTYLGHNPNFPSEEDWMRRGGKSQSEPSSSQNSENEE